MLRPLESCVLGPSSSFHDLHVESTCDPSAFHDSHSDFRETNSRSDALFGVGAQVASASTHGESASSRCRVQCDKEKEPVPPAQTPLVIWYVPLMVLPEALPVNERAVATPNAADA